MKKIFGITIIIFLFTSVGYAGSKLIERDSLGNIGDNFIIRTICTDGYKFVVAGGRKGDSFSVSMVQFYVNQNGNVVPATCNM